MLIVGRSSMQLLQVRSTALMNVGRGLKERREGSIEEGGSNEVVAAPLSQNLEISALTADTMYHMH